MMLLPHRRFALEMQVTSARTLLMLAATKDKCAHPKAAAAEENGVQLMSSADASGQRACPLPGDVNKCAVGSRTIQG